MANTREGSIRLFHFAGVDVFLHWSWFLVAIYEIQGRHSRYSSVGWNIAEYLALSLIVTLHEFGHAMACRQVGGTANQIVLWPLGGTAYVDPPPRPGATLWSIAAGPLVNLALLPLLYWLFVFGRSAEWALSSPDLYRLVRSLLTIDLVLLVFNMLPIYPLDGGQILRSLLWFVIGRARSLMVATSLGFVGVVGFIGLAVWRHSVWYGAVAIFMLMNCWGGLQHARALLKLSKLPRRDGYQCPNCRTAPPLGAFWKCGQCGQPFDTFASGASCPNCRAQYAETKCLDCGKAYPMHVWAGATLAPTSFDRQYRATISD
ncbi:MAG TPA: site-2 protease family protein [Terriglobales bacterium]|nr:site-2 protease family protein [Terriglobales bacterium]